MNMSNVQGICAKHKCKAEAKYCKDLGVHYVICQKCEEDFDQSVDKLAEVFGMKSPMVTDYSGLSPLQQYVEARDED